MIIVLLYNNFTVVLIFYASGRITSSFADISYKNSMYETEKLTFEYISQKYFIAKNKNITSNR
jgi:hypothetical protein